MSSRTLTQRWLALITQRTLARRAAMCVSPGRAMLRCSQHWSCCFALLDKVELSFLSSAQRLRMIATYASMFSHRHRKLRNLGCMETLCYVKEEWRRSWLDKNRRLSRELAFRL